MSGIEPPYLSDAFEERAYRSNIAQLRDWTDMISAPWEDPESPPTDTGSEGFPVPVGPVPPPDGLAPASSPTPTLEGGPGYLVVKWTPVTNVDPVTYDVHLSRTPAFTSSPATYCGSTPGSLFFIRSEPGGAPLEYGITYYVQVLAKDADGLAPPGAEVSGQMVQVDTEDIAVDAITADQILAGSITAEKLEAVLVLATKIVAGASITSPRTEMDSEGVHIFSDAENMVAELTGTTLSFGTLYAGQIFSPSILGRNDLSFTLFVNPALGSDLNDGASMTPLQTVSEALRRIPRFNTGTILISLTAGSTVEESLLLDGFFGSGSLTIDGNGSTFSGTVLISGCRHDLFLQDLVLSDDGEGDTGNTVYVKNSSYVDLNIKIQSNGLKASNVRFTASQGRIHGCDLGGATARCVAAEAQSLIHCDDNVGAGVGDAYRSNASIIFATGTRPTGGTSKTNQGQIFDDGGSSAGGSGGSSSKRTKYYLATATASWRTWDNDWRSDDDYVYQGGSTYGNHKGLWFYDDAQIRTDLAGKTIDSISIYIRRRSEGGWSSAQTMRWKTHNYHSRPGGEPSLLGGSDIGSMAWGDTKWIKLPNSFAADLRDNQAKGIAIHYPGTTGYDKYVLLDGENEMNESGRLKIVFH